MTYSNLEPAAVWRHFAALNAIPRVSKNEAAAMAYVTAQADAAGASWKRDDYGNVVVYVPGTLPGPTVMIQSHVDMVPAVAPGTSHDWATDPIIPRREGDWIYATGTTLGADNGMGAAMALALLTDGGVPHGPLELLFTVEEEIGLRGASQLDASLVSAKYMINLDSEEIEKLTIGCTGGATLELTVPITRVPPPAASSTIEITVTGALGGHSGLEIDKRRANPIKMLGGLLRRLIHDGTGTKIASIEGGSAANAIPKSASAIISVPYANQDQFDKIASELEAETFAKWQDAESDLKVVVAATGSKLDVVDDFNANALLELIKDLPHSVQRWSDIYPGKVETSANVAQIATEGDTVKVVTSVRSFFASALDATQAQIRDLTAQAGGIATLVSGYPGWEPSTESRLQKLTEKVYADTYGHAPEIEVVHAGLECGAIISKLPTLEAVSFGPDIRGAHTPDECVSIPTVKSTWHMLAALLGALAEE